MSEEEHLCSIFSKKVLPMILFHSRKGKSKTHLDTPWCEVSTPISSSLVLCLLVQSFSSHSSLQYASWCRVPNLIAH